MSLVVNGVAQVGQIDAAKRTVPVGAVALSAIERLAGHIRSDSGTLPAKPALAPVSCFVFRGGPAGKLAIIIRAYISFASGYLTLKFRQKPPWKNRLIRAQRSSCSNS